MIKQIILHIINKFSTNKIKLNDNGFYTFDHNPEKIPGIDSKTDTSCVAILEKILKEVNYMKQADTINADILKKLIMAMEDLSNESLILYLAYFNFGNQNILEHYSSCQTNNIDKLYVNDIDKLNKLLFSKFHSNDIDFFQCILAHIFKIKYEQTDDKYNDIQFLLKNIADIKSMLLFLTDTPYEKELMVGIYNNTLIDDNIDTNKKYKIKEFENNIIFNNTNDKAKAKCFPSFYEDPGQNPLRETQPANVILKNGWKRELTKIKPAGITKKFVNSFYRSLMFLSGKINDADDVFFKNKYMCQRRWRNTEIIDEDADEAAAYDDEKYVNLGENIYNLYDPDITEYTNTNSNEYKNNEILNRIWFYMDDIFPVEPNPEQQYNKTQFRNEFTFKNVNIKKEDILLKSNFEKEDLHYMIPILWLYKIYNEYNYITGEKNKNIEMLFNYFKPEDLLIYFKRCILVEYNTLDNETLAFFIILGALSHVTSFMVDERVITDNVKDFKPDDFYLFKTILNNDAIKDDIKKHILNTKKNTYLSFLTSEISRIIGLGTLNDKISNEYEMRKYEKKKQHIKTVFNILQLTGSVNFASLRRELISIDENLIGYNRPDTKPLSNYISKQIANIDNLIADKVPVKLIEASVNAANSLSIQESQLSIMPTLQLSKPTITSIMPIQVDLMLAKNLTDVIIGTQTINGLTVPVAHEVLGLLNLKSSITMSLSAAMSASPILYTPPNPELLSKLNSDPEIIDMFKDFRASIPPSDISTGEMIESLRSIGYRHTLGRNVERLKEQILLDRAAVTSPAYHKFDPQYKEVLSKRMPENDKEYESEMRAIASIDHSIESLKEILNRVPKRAGVVSVKAQIFIHGSENNLRKRIIADCGDFKYVGLLGEPGKLTTLYTDGMAKFQSSIFDEMPDPSTLKPPTSRYCELPDIELGLHTDPDFDDIMPGISVEITYADGTVKTETLASNHQLIRILTKNHAPIGKKDAISGLHISSYITFVDTILRIHGLDPLDTSVVFDSCRGVESGNSIVRAGGIISETSVAEYAEICAINFLPYTPEEFRAIEVKRTLLPAGQSVGTEIEIESPLIFDSANPRRFGGELINIQFTDKPFTYRDGSISTFKPDVCSKSHGDIDMPYTLWVAFNEYLSKNPKYLLIFNDMSVREKVDFMEKHILDKLFFRDGLDGNSDPFLAQTLYQRNPAIDLDLPRIFNEFFFPPSMGDRIEDRWGCTNCPDDNRAFYMRQAFEQHQLKQKLQQEQETKGSSWWPFGGKGKKVGGNPKKDNDIIEFVHKKLKELLSWIAHYKTEEIILDDSIHSQINQLDISNSIKSIKLILEKCKIQLMEYKNEMAKKGKDFYEYLYTYFYEVIYFQLLNEVNKYKMEIKTLEAIVDQQDFYLNLFNKQFIKDTFLEFKTQKPARADIQKPARADIKKTIDEVIINRWANYMLLFDMPGVNECNLHKKIGAIEFGLIMEKHDKKNILEPLILSIPNYNELVDENYEKYGSEARKLKNSGNYNFIENDFLIHYYTRIYNTIQNIQSNINEIRKINTDIIANIVNKLDEPLQLTAKNNIYSYSKQLTEIMDNADQLYDYKTDNTYINAPSPYVLSYDENIPIKLENLELWTYQMKENTMEHKIIEINKKTQPRWDEVQMYKTIEILIK